ncbi:MAG: CotH kinase family protein [Bacteroidales bacterium]|nr:CotH kinase family protein [Bacteroidales bacterium]
MSSNVSKIADEDGDFSDWVEFFYTGEKTINLMGFGFSDNSDDPFQWIFPDVTLHPGQFLLVWASGKDRAIPGSPLHTNFSISAEGEALFLTNPYGSLVSESPPVLLHYDFSYGHQPDGSEAWYYFTESTPGVSNSTQGYNEIIEPPSFSHAGGFYTEEFSLKLSHPDPDATIIYTLDGSTPNPANLEGFTFQYKNHYPQNPGDPFGDFIAGSVHSLHYTDSIAIVDRTNKPDSLTCISSTFHKNPYYFPVNPVYKGTVVRAVAIKEGAIPSPVISNTYFVSEDGRNRYSLPLVSISIDKDAMFDYENGIYTAGIDYDNWRTENPEAPHNWLTQANFHRTSDEWEKRAHFEYFDAKSSFPDISHEIGIRIHGNEARRRAMKSLRLYARSEYGESCFNHRFFPDLEDDHFKRLILRNSGQDYYSTLLRDALIQTVVSDLEFDTQDYIPSIVFINGEYWGIHNLRERYDRHYLERVYGVDPEKLDYITNLNEIGEGDLIHYNETIDFIEENGLAEEEHYQYIQTRIDVNNFRDYQIANIYVDNHDWPGNNLDYWRLRTDEFIPNAPAGHDGRWRWLMYDMDFGFGLFGLDTALVHNTLEMATAPDHPEYPNPPWSTFLLRKFLENDDFKTSFIIRFTDLLNTTFKPQHIINTLNELKQVIEPEIPEHILRWKNLYHAEHWNSNLNVLIDFANLRPQYQRQHLLEYFDLQGECLITLNTSNRWHGHLRINTIEITEDTPGIRTNPYPWSGIYFKGVPIELEAIPAEGYAFSHWSGDLRGTDPIVNLIPEEDFEATAHFVRVDVPRLVYFWLFDASLPNDTPLDTLDPTYKILEGAKLTFHSALIGYPFTPEDPNWRKASMERRNDPTPLNYRPSANNNLTYEESDMRGIQIKQPFTGDGGENIISFNLPSTGLTDLIFRFAAKDEGAAENLLIEYSVVQGEPVWSSSGLLNFNPSLSQEFQLYELDFTSIIEVNENPNFKLRIRFEGSNMTADEGNRVNFNNFSLDGLVMTPENLPPEVVGPVPLQQTIEGGDELEFYLDDIFMDPDNDQIHYSVLSDPSGMTVALIDANILTIYPEKRGGATISITATDSITEPFTYSFKLTIYPKAFALHNNRFTFEAFSADEPENTFPEHILFMQSEVDDPGIYEPLPYAYFIPHDDYHEEDSMNIGFPFKNVYRTRINGMGEEGISFINTGRNRDLGGLLLALDTREVSFADMSWVASTLLKNERVYAIRLQYRTDINDSFVNLLVNNQPVEYICGNDGNMTEFKEIPLPQFLHGKDYLQLLWKYYFVEGETGARAQLRLDDIEIKDITYIPEVEPDEINMYSAGSLIYIKLPEKTDGEVSIFDLSGRLVSMQQLTGSSHFAMNMSPRKGVFIVRIISTDQVVVKKLMIN